MFGYIDPSCQTFPHFWHLLFSPQPIAKPSSHHFFLSIQILNESDPSFLGFFDSRVKCLRDKIENHYKAV